MPRRIEKSNIPRPYNLITNERKLNTEFDINEMYEFLEGNNPETAASVKRYAQILERDLTFRNKPDYYENSTKKEIRKNTFLKVKRLAMIIEEEYYRQKKSGVSDLDIDFTFKKILPLVGVFDPQTMTRLAIHSGLFCNAIRGNGTKEQYHYWVFEKGALFCQNIYGCFGMTEMAHGSNVAGVETTAEYDFKTKTFTLNTPHLGATKWWIGGAAHTANHCAVYARLIVKGQDYGVKVFVVPLRDVNHELYPGVSIGDIGSKMGREGIDNGWIQFSDVKIPKNFLLQRFVKIDDEEEEVIDSPLNQLAYGALLDGRSSMVEDSYRVGARAVTVALRYAVGRRQFGKAENIETNFASKQEIDTSLKLEKQLIDYPSHQYRLLPLLATVYCLSSVSTRVQKELDSVKDKLDDDAILTNQKALMAVLNELKEIFVVSASCKATATWFTAKTIDECRQACGGHGYSAYSGFGKQYDDWVVQCTWEGDNTVLSSNAGRSIVKYRIAAKKGKLKTVPQAFQFLGKDYEKVSDLSSYDDLQTLFSQVITKLADEVIEILPKFNNNFEKVSTSLITISKFSYYRYTLETVVATLKENKGKTIKPVLEKIILLFAYHTIKENGVYFLKNSLLNSKQFEEIEVAIFRDLLPFLRKQAVALTDSFQLSDFFVNSPLGSYDGDFYNKYFDTINQNNNNHPGYSNCDYQQEIIATLTRTSIEDRQQGVQAKDVLEKLGK